jgi:hypothetical protein
MKAKTTVEINKFIQGKKKKKPYSRGRGIFPPMD